MRIVRIRPYITAVMQDCHRPRRDSPSLVSTMSSPSRVITVTIDHCRSSDISKTSSHTRISDPMLKAPSKTTKKKLKRRSNTLVPSELSLNVQWIYITSSSIKLRNRYIQWTVTSRKNLDLTVLLPGIRSYRLEQHLPRENDMHVNARRFRKFRDMHNTFQWQWHDIVQTDILHNVNYNDVSMDLIFLTRQKRQVSQERLYT